MLARLVLGLALVDAYSPGGASLGVRSLRSRRTTTVTNDLSILGAEDAACVMLPQCACQAQTQHQQACPTRYSPGRALGLAQHALRRLGALVGLWRGEPPGVLSRVVRV